MIVIRNDDSISVDIHYNHYRRMDFVIGGIKMSREYKFRAWFEDGKKMYGVHEISFFHGNIISVALCNLKTLEGPYFYFDIEDIELMQYTGLKDKYGVEIYEGDILKASGYPAIEVIYDKENCSFKMKVQHIGWEDLLILSSKKTLYIEVIGNIYENPKLLGGKYE